MAKCYGGLLGFSLTMSYEVKTIVNQDIGMNRVEILDSCSSPTFTPSSLIRLIVDYVCNGIHLNY
jgi:hypothetical protein